MVYNDFGVFCIVAGLRSLTRECSMIQNGQMSLQTKMSWPEQLETYTTLSTILNLQILRYDIMEEQNPI